MRSENKGLKVSEVGGWAIAFGRAFAELSPACENAHFAAELCVRNQIVEKLFNGPPAGFEGTRTDAKRPELCNVFPTCEVWPHQSMREFYLKAKIRLIYFRVNELEGLRLVRK